MLHGVYVKVQYVTQHTHCCLANTNAHFIALMLPLLLLLLMLQILQEAAKQAELSSSSIGGWVSWALGYGTSTANTTTRESAEAQFEQL
jgi:hypothetical protein